jgi:hypothetical protein
MLPFNPSLSVFDCVSHHDVKLTEKQLEPELESGKEQAFTSLIRTAIAAPCEAVGGEWLCLKSQDCLLDIPICHY